MVHKATGQLGFADAWLGYNQKLNQQLNKIDQLVDWLPFEQLLSRGYASPTGRPSHPVLVLFKALLLQTWHNLSDYALEEALDDRLSFRRFVSLSMSERAPDHSVFSRFRDELIKHGIHDRLFSELHRQLEGQGLIIKKGILVDATVIEAAPKRPLHNEDGSTGKSQQDPEAHRNIFPFIPYRKMSGREIIGTQEICQTFCLTKNRWVVERAFAWLKRRCRRLMLR